MPEHKTIERARRDARRGKSPSTQAGEFVREEFHHIREGKHGARSPRQAIAIGLSKARRAGVRLSPPKSGSRKVRRQARRELQRASGGQHRVSRRRSRATLGALKREGRGAASTRAISRQTRSAARRRSPANRSVAARKAARTRHPIKRMVAARRITRTRSSLSNRVRTLARSWRIRHHH